MYGLVLRKSLIPALGDIKLQELKPADVQHYIAKAVKDGYGGATIRQHLAILSGALKAALLNNLVTHNVVGTVADKPRVPRPTTRVRANTLVASEARQLLAEAAKIGPMEHSYYAMMLSSGMRRSEAAALQWTKIDFDKGSITVDVQLDVPDEQGHFMLGPTKTADTRVIIVGDDVLKLLRAHRQHQSQVKLKAGRADHYADNGFVFAREHVHLTEPWHKLGMPLYVDSRGPGRLDVLTKRANIKAISPHGLRDTCASLLAANGVPLKVISERLGHARASMTLDRYISVLPGMQETAAKQLNTVLHAEKVPSFLQVN